MKSLSLSCCLFVFGSIFFSTSAFADQRFLAKTRIILDGNEIGTPALLLEPGVESSASVEDKYALILSANDAGNDQVHINIQLTTKGKTQSPIMQVKYGEEASFKTDDVFFSVMVVEE